MRLGYLRIFYTRGVHKVAFKNLSQRQMKRQISVIIVK